jgi:hypothetical protein
MSKVTQEQAFAHYLMLGSHRSFEKLRTFYASATPPQTVSIDTLKYWSRKHGWVAKAATHDEQVAGRLAERAEREDAQRQWNNVESLLQVAQRCLDAVAKAQISVATPQDLRALVTAAIEGIKMAEVLTGGVSDRVAHPKTDEAVASLEAIERRLRAVPKTGGDAA